MPRPRGVLPLRPLQPQPPRQLPPQLPHLHLRPPSRLRLPRPRPPTGPLRSQTRRPLLPRRRQPLGKSPQRSRRHLER
jgi:hypothetical protein